MGHARRTAVPLTAEPSPLACSVALAAGPSAARAAREFTTGTLLGWELPAVLDDAVLIASELVTNAVHALGAAPAAGIELAWQHWADRVVCVVTDGAPGAPVCAAAGPYAESGRGLQVVGALAADWGWLMLGAGSGAGSRDGMLDPRKAVWAAVAIPRG